MAVLGSGAVRESVAWENIIGNAREIVLDCFTICVIAISNILVQCF